MDGMALAAQGIQNPAIPDLAQPADWANYLPGYTLAQRNAWVQSFASNSQPGYGACLFDMVASSITYDRFLEIKNEISSGVEPESIADFSTAMYDCENGTFHSLNQQSATTTVTPIPEVTSTSSPTENDANKYLRLACPAIYRRNDSLPLVKCDKGPGVKYVQEILGVNPDNYFGNNTINALIQFQKIKGIPSTGVIDLETWRALDPEQTGPGTDINGDGLVTPDEFGR
jgi:hypothetical protein